MTIFRPCCSQYATRSGTRAMVPSSFMISQMTPAGIRPARRARSTAASVWPARASTPPGRATQREDVARLDQVLGAAARVDGHLDGVGPVGRRDAGGHALPRLDGHGEGGAEPRLVVRAPWGAGAAPRARSAVIDRQMRPRPCAAMKLMASGVTNWAAMVRSPSFSRSSSSTTTTMRPALDLLEGLLDGGESCSSQSCLRSSHQRTPVRAVTPRVRPAARGAPPGLAAGRSSPRAPPAPAAPAARSGPARPPPDSPACPP